MIHTFVYLYIKLKYSNNFYKNKSPKLLVNHCHKIKKRLFSNRILNDLALLSQL